MRKFHDTFQNSLGTLAVETPKKNTIGGKVLEFHANPGEAF